MPSRPTKSTDNGPAFPTERKQQGLQGATDWLTSRLGPDSAFTRPRTGHASSYTLMLLGQNIRPLGGRAPCQAPSTEAQLGLPHLQGENSPWQLLEGRQGFPSPSSRLPRRNEGPTDRAAQGVQKLEKTLRGHGPQAFRFCL